MEELLLVVIGLLTPAFGLGAILLALGAGRIVKGAPRRRLRPKQTPPPLTAIKAKPLARA